MLESTQYATIKLLGIVKSFYNVPRFGHTKDISYFFSDSNSLKNNYHMGLIMVFMTFMLFAAIWFIALIILRLLGSKAGCASGNAATIPAESMMSKGSYSVHTDETGEFIVMQADQNRVNRTRLIYFTAGLFTLISSGVLLYGIILLMHSFTSFHDSAEDVLNYVSTANIDKFMDTAKEFSTSKDVLMTHLPGYCNGAGVDVNGINPSSASSAFETSLATVDDISNDSTWSAIEVDLSDIEILLERMVTFLGRVDGVATVWFVLATTLVGILIVFCVYMLGCAWKSGKDGYQFVGEDRPTCYSNFLNYIATPLFGLLLACTWFAVSIIFTSQVLNADLCYGEIITGETVLNILIERGYAKTTDAYIMTDEYLHGCENVTGTPTGAINDLMTILDDVSAKADDFQALTPNDDATLLQSICGTAATDDVLGHSKQTIQLLDTFQKELEVLHNSVSCDTMAPIMQKALYENSCHSLSVGLFWSFLSCLCVATFGTVMLSLRSATLRPQIYIVAANPASRSDDIDNDSSFG